MIIDFQFFPDFKSPMSTADHLYH